jgi:ribosome-associated translation inhibitor RaiA
MQIPLQITLRHMPNSAALTARIYEEARKLASHRADIVSCRVVVEQLDRHKGRPRSFSVRLALGVPGDELVVNHDYDEDVYVAVRDAFASLNRCLGDFKHRRHQAVRRRASGSSADQTV